MVKKKGVIIAVLAILLAGVCALLLFLPFPKNAGQKEESYPCRWENGEQSTERYSQAYPALIGARDGVIFLERDGIRGEIAASDEFIRVTELFERASLAELLNLKVGELSRLERAALWKTYGGRGYYAGEFFAWDGELFARSKREKFEEVCLVSGTLKKGVLRDTGAKKLIITGTAEFYADALIGSDIEEVAAFAPYSAAGGAIYLQRAVGTILIAALPGASELAVDCDLIDDGALAPCTGLKKLTLPEWYDGTLGKLFGETPVPEDLVVL